MSDGLPRFAGWLRRSTYALLTGAPVEAEKPYGPDPLAAMRRVIVRAAAALADGETK